MNNSNSNSNSESNFFLDFIKSITDYFKSDEQKELDNKRKELDNKRKELEEVQELINKNRICENAGTFKNPTEREIYIYNCIDEELKKRGITDDDLKNIGGKLAWTILAKKELSTRTISKKNTIIESLLSPSGGGFFNNENTNGDIPEEYKTDYQLLKILESMRYNGITFSELSSYSDEGKQLAENIQEAEERIKQYETKQQFVELQRQSISGELNSNSRDLMYSTRSIAVEESLVEKRNEELLVENEINSDIISLDNKKSDLLLKTNSISEKNTELENLSKSLASAKNACGTQSFFTRDDSKDCNNIVFYSEKIAALTKTIETLNTEKKVLENEISGLETKISNLKSVLSETQKEISKLEIEQVSLSQNSNSNGNNSVSLNSVEGFYSFKEPSIPLSYGLSQGFSMNGGQTDLDSLNYKFGSVYLDLEN